MKVHFCKDCRWFVPADEDPQNGGHCAQRWQSLVTGEDLMNGHIPALYTRMNFCGISAVGFEPREESQSS